MHLDTYMNRLRATIESAMECGTKELRIELPESLRKSKAKAPKEECVLLCTHTQSCYIDGHCKTLNDDQYYLLSYFADHAGNSLSIEEMNDELKLQAEICSVIDTLWKKQVYNQFPFRKYIQRPGGRSNGGYRIRVQWHNNEPKENNQ